MLGIYIIDIGYIWLYNALENIRILYLFYSHIVIAIGNAWITAYGSRTTLFCFVYYLPTIKFINAHRRLINKIVIYNM